MDRQQHWNAVYTTKGERDVSWFEASPDVSIEMIEAAGLTRDTCVLDVGGGDSRLVNLLVSRGPRPMIAQNTRSDCTRRHGARRRRSSIRV